MDQIRPGLVGESKLTVTKEVTASAYGSGLVAVLATPVMVGLMENASVDAIQKHIPPGQTSVGIEVCVKHLAATPIGLQTRARSEVIGVDGRRITFKVQAWDDHELIGEGTHQRMVVDEARFVERIEAKAKSKL
jgi:fluoroacetyl-CoA thioesterase